MHVAIDSNQKENTIMSWVTILTASVVPADFLKYLHVLFIHCIFPFSSF